MTLPRFLVQAALIFLFSNSNASAQDSPEIKSPPGILAVLDEPASQARMVLYAAGEGEPLMADRNQLDSDAAASGKTITWIPIPKAQILKELSQLPIDDATFDGAAVHEISFTFSDAENVDVHLSLTLKGSSQEEPFINEANKILEKLVAVKNVQFGARPAKVSIALPDQAAALTAINADLAKPELRLSGCTISTIKFEQENDVRTSFVDGTIAFPFQSDAVIAAIAETLTNHGLGDWDEVKPLSTTFRVQTPDMEPYTAELRKAIRGEDSTALKVILLDASLERSKDAPDHMLVILDGHVSTAETTELVVEIANEIASSFFAMYLTPSAEESLINVDPRELQLKVTSRSSSKQFVRLALNYDQEMRPLDALSSLELAAFEDKRAMETMYWLAVMQLKTCDEEGARKSLSIAVRENARLMEDAKNGSNNRYSEMLHSLESIQGPLRQRLHELEGRVYSRAIAC